MPLVIVTGFPCAGKTTKAKELVALLEGGYNEGAYSDQEESLQGTMGQENSGRPIAPHQAVKSSIVLINDERLLIPKSMYATKEGEGIARGRYFSAVQRHLSSTCFVILDGMNYIKGFRYQLYCLSKELRTTFMCIHVAVSKETSILWNQHRIQSSPSPSSLAKDAAFNDYYEPELLESLCFRYEEPNAFNRWDSPLLTLLSEDSVSSFFTSHIVKYLIDKEPPKPNLSTALKPVSQANYFGDVDRLVQAVVDACVAHQRNQATASGSVISFTDASGEPQNLEFPDRNISVAELRRHKRQFISLNKMHSMAPSQVQAEFVRYLARSLGE